MTDAPRTTRFSVLVPVFDDWRAASLLLEQLDAALAEGGLTADVVLVDDGSPTSCQALALPASFAAIARVQVVELGRNLGHQRAIAIGLAWCAEHHDQAVVVMDGDGEDDPREIAGLVRCGDEHAGRRVVFAHRSRRREGLVFRGFYQLYKLGFRVATGTVISFGNFSFVPPVPLRRLVYVSELWNNYAAGVMKARIPYATVAVPRARRLAGESRMNFTSLVVHGLSALSVHADTISVRAIVAAGALAVAMMGLIATVVGIRLFTELAIPGWASAVVGLAVNVLLQSLLMSSVFAFLVLGSRNLVGFLPKRDHRDFVGAVHELHRRASALGEVGRAP